MNLLCHGQGPRPSGKKFTYFWATRNKSTWNIYSQIQVQDKQKKWHGCIKDDLVLHHKGPLWKQCAWIWGLGWPSPRVPAFCIPSKQCTPKRIRGIRPHLVHSLFTWPKRLHCFCNGTFCFFRWPNFWKVWKYALLKTVAFLRPFNLQHNAEFRNGLLYWYDLFTKSDSSYFCAISQFGVIYVWSCKKLIKVEERH